MMSVQAGRGAGHDASARRQWMSVLALASPARLSELVSRNDFPPFSYLRKPETGLVMVRGRCGGTGNPFNFGEMTVTRCSVRLEDGTIGHAYVAGRSSQHAEIAAVCDALLQQQEGREALVRTVIRPLAEEEIERRHRLVAKSRATKVDFFTMVRGDDA